MFIRAAALIIFALPAHADTICDRFENLETAPPAVSEQSLQNMNCQTSIALGGATSTHCAWGFAYRSVAATMVFDDFLNRVSACGPAIPQTGPEVSHPDSYDLRQFQVGDKTVSVSLKDKGALSQTYDFLRVTTQAGG